MTVNVSVQMIACGIFHPLFQFNQFCILSRHVDPDICRNSLFLVGKPFDQICIPKWGYPHRLILIINLTVQIIHFKLGHHIHHASHLSVSQKCGGIPV